MDVSVILNCIMHAVTSYSGHSNDELFVTQMNLYQCSRFTAVLLPTLCLSPEQIEYASFSIGGTILGG